MKKFVLFISLVIFCFTRIPFKTQAQELKDLLHEYQDIKYGYANIKDRSCSYFNSDSTMIFTFIKIYTRSGYLLMISFKDLVNNQEYYTEYVENMTSFDIDRKKMVIKWDNKIIPLTKIRCLPEEDNTVYVDENGTVY